MPPNKKKLIYIIIAIVAVIAITTGTIFLLKSLRTNDGTTQSETKTVPTIETANSLKTQAIEALRAKSNNQAKALFQECKQQFEEIIASSTDETTVQAATMGKIDCDTQIQLLEYSDNK